MPGRTQYFMEESGLIVETAAPMNNKFIPPGQNALFDIIITNESPYRESHIYGLQLISGSQYTGDFGGNMLVIIHINGVPNLLRSNSWSCLTYLRLTTTNLKYTRLSLNIQKGSFPKYSSIGVELVSECEWTMSRDILCPVFDLLQGVP